jgi:hypothetical protein
LASQAYLSYLGSPKWRAIATETKIRAGWKCENCGDDRRHVLEAHHITYAYLFHEDEHSECLVCLCRECHKNAHISRGFRGVYSDLGRTPEGLRGAGKMKLCGRNDIKSAL